MAASGLCLEPKPERTVRLGDQHLAALGIIQVRESRPGSRLTRVGAVRRAIHAYCAELTQGRRYQSFSELVRDAVAWYAKLVRAR